MSHPDLPRNGKRVSDTLRLAHCKTAFSCINRPPAGEGLFVESPAVALIVFLQARQSATLHFAAAFVKA